MPAPQPRPLVFISHSANGDKPAGKELERIDKHLKTQGFEVLLDRERLEGGDPWRAYLDLWMAQCAGAILLLTPKALASPWVRKEATILLWRRARDPGFLLIPVFSGVTASEVRRVPPLEPLALTEVQAVKDLHGLPLAKKLGALLAPLKAAVATGGRGTLVHKIANHLANVKRPALLDEVAQQLDIDLGGWDPKLDRAGKVAMLLLQAPTEKLAAALEPLLGVLPDSSIREIVNMLRGCWIDRELAGRFAVLALGPTGRRIAAVNASLTPFTPSAILMRASARYPPWRHFPVSATAGEDIVGAIVAQVRADLAAAHPDWADAEVAEEMSDLGKTQPGVIVIAPPVDSEPLIGDDEIAELVGRFPAWTVLVLTGTKQRVAVGQSIRSLAPALATGEEAAARKQFRAIEARIAQVGASR